MSWPSIALGEVCKPKQHKTIPASELLEKGFVVYGANGPIGYYSHFTHDRTTIAVTCRGATCGTINVVPPKSYVTGNAMALDDLDESRVNLSFLRHVLEYQGFTSVINGAAQPQITRAPLLKYTIPLPPLEEQERIAGVLDQADALLRLRARALDKLGTLGQAIFHEMFGNPLNAGNVSLSDVLLASGNGLQVDQDESGEGLPVTRIETIWNGEIDPHRVKWSSPDMARAERFLLRPGDILFSHINSPEHIAKTAIYEGHPDRLLHGINLLRLQPDREKVSPYWLMTFLKTDPVRNFFRARCKKAVNQASLNQKNLSELNFKLPDYDAQVIFSERLAGISAQIPVHVSSSEKFDALFAAAQYRAFRGQL